MGQDASFPALPPGTKLVNINGLNLTRIPFYLPPNHAVRSIEASHNTLSSFPLELTNVMTIDVSFNSLREIPDEKFSFPNLRKLNIASNNLSKLPVFLNNFSKLNEINFEKNCLTELNLDIPKIEKINLFLNCLINFPSLPQSVSIIDLGFNQIRDVDVNFQNLKELNLSGNDITNFSENCSFPLLEKLDVSLNKLVSIPNLAKVCPKLHSLHLAYNFLAEFPELPNTIERCDVSHNCIEKLDKLTGYEDLLYLDISYNNLSKLPELPKNLNRLLSDHNKFESCYPIENQYIRGIQFYNNHFESIPIISGSSITHVLFKHNLIKSINVQHLCETVTMIDLTSNLLTSIPEELFDFDQLKNLNVSSNLLTSIPEKIQASTLQVLNLADNPISSLPQLPRSLKELICCRCQFQELPKTITSCINLQKVNFSGNSISSVDHFPEVERINLSCNQISYISKIPEFISSVNLSHNNLTDFVIEREMQFLTFLDISHNKISHIKFQTLVSLETLKLSHNPLNFKFNFSLFPNLKCGDFLNTKISHPKPVPQNVRELVSNYERYSKDSTQIKYFKSTKSGYAESIGLRPTMEDSLIIREDFKPALYGVIDGHGGYTTSSTAAMLIPKIFKTKKNKTISELAVILRQVNETLSKSHVNDGATIVLATVTDSKIGVAHCGDSRALVVKKDGKCVPLTVDHKATDRVELDMLKTNKAFVQSGRLSSHLAVSRAIGDFSIEGVSHVPDLSTYTIDKDDFRLILACDGIFDVLENEDVGKIVVKNKDVHKAAALLKGEALAKGSTDNISVIVIDIEK